MIACLATMRTGRPLTGILFFNNDLCDLYDEVFPEFPSPYGDFVFQLLDQVKENRKLTENGFRPLTGILFFNISVREKYHL